MFSNKQNYTVIIKAFITLPFPAMISLLVTGVAAEKNV